MSASISHQIGHQAPGHGGAGPQHQRRDGEYTCVVDPGLAAVGGPAVGIGTTLLLHCDLVYASEQSRFAVPFTQLGVCAEFASSLLLPQLAGYHRAADILLTGEFFPVEVAAQIGLVNRVLPASELENFVRSKAHALAALPSDAVRTTKRLMKATQASLVDVVMQERCF